MLYRRIFVLLLGLTLSTLPSAQTATGAAPTALDKFAPSQVISIDNAVAFPVDI